jgi:CAAX prenyl protease-like protein
MLRLLGSVAIVPIAEELAFRGYLVRRLTSSDFTAVPSSRFSLVPLLASSAAFGLLHQRWLAGMLAGMVFYLAQSLRGRLADAIVAHAVANLLIALAVIGAGRWELWS